MISLPQSLHEIRLLVGKNELDKAINLLVQVLQHSPELDEAIQQQGAYQEICQQVRGGTISQESATLAKNQIRSGILELLRHIELHNEKDCFSNLLEIVERQAKLLKVTDERGGTTKKQVQFADKIYNIRKIDNGYFS